MSQKINYLDKTLNALNILTHNRKHTTVTDINNLVKLNEEVVENIMIYLTSLNYSDQKNNSFRITFEGQLFISKSNFPYKNKPFLYEKRYKSLKYWVLFLNSCLVLGIGLYSAFKRENTKNKVDKIEIICNHTNDVNYKQNDSIK